MIDEGAARRFLALDRVAVVGASSDRRKFGNTIFRELRARGIDAVPVNPTAPDVEGVPCVPSVGGLPDDVTGIVVMVRGDAARDAVRAAAARGITDVWLFRGLGSPGAATADVFAECEAHGIAPIAGACPLMFLQPVGAVHRIHRGMRRLNGSLRRAS